MSASSIELGEVVDIVMGQAPPGAACNKDGTGAVFVKAGEFQERIPLIREWTTQPLKMAAPDDSLVCVVGATAGKVNYSAFKCAIGRSVAAVRPQSTRLNPLFLYQFLQTKVEQLRDRSQGAAQGVITREMLQSLKLVVPPLPEQRHIAAILDKADALRIKRREALAQLDRLAQSIFVDMFGDPVANPKGYPSAALAGLVEPDRGITYGIVQRGDDCDEGVPVLRIRDLADDEIDVARLKKTSPEVSAQYRRTVLRGGEIAISIRGTVGRCCIVPSNLVGGNVSREIALVPVRSDVSAVFVQQVLRSPSVQRLIADNVKGVAQSGINLEDLRELRVLQPPAAEVRAFEAKATFASTLLRDGRIALEELGKLAATLQHRAFRGEL